MSKEIDYLQRIEMLRRAGHVERMHCVRPLVQRGYSVAEHTYNAMIIARELCLLNMRDPGPVLARVLLHDAAEVETGDMPANVKRMSPDAGAAMAELEAMFEEKWDLTEPEVKHLRMQKIPGEKFTELDQAIYKASDYLELGWFCLVERRLGNRYIHGGQSVARVIFNVQLYLQELFWVPGVKDMSQYLKTQWERVQ